MYYVLKEFLPVLRMFKDSLRLEKLTDLDAKGAKRSVKMWTTNFSKSFFEKYCVVRDWWAVKNSFTTYVCYAPDVLF